MKLHPKLPTQLRKSNEVLGAPAEGNRSCSPPAVAWVRGFHSLRRAGQPAASAAAAHTTWGTTSQLPPENSMGRGEQWVPGTFETSGITRERCLLQPWYLSAIHPALPDEEAAVSQGQGKTSWRVYKQEIPVSKVTVKIIPPSPTIPEQETLSSY